jgi:hypothetical protein
MRGTHRAQTCFQIFPVGFSAVILPLHAAYCQILAASWNTMQQMFLRINVSGRNVGITLLTNTSTKPTAYEVSAGDCLVRLSYLSVESSTHVRGEKSVEHSVPWQTILFHKWWCWIASPFIGDAIYLHTFEIIFTCRLIAMERVDRHIHGDGFLETNSLRILSRDTSDQQTFRWILVRYIRRRSDCRRVRIPPPWPCES